MQHAAPERLHGSGALLALVVNDLGDPRCGDAKLRGKLLKGLAFSKQVANPVISLVVLLAR